jgi:hypothetical protein
MARDYIARVSGEAEIMIREDTEQTCAIRVPEVTRITGLN